LRTKLPTENERPTLILVHHDGFQARTILGWVKSRAEALAALG